MLLKTLESAGSSNSGVLLSVGSQDSPQDEINLKDLTPFQRILLMTDGTVTDILEAFFMESMRVIKLSQDHCEQDNDSNLLEIGKGHRILRRRILLQGRSSGRNYIYAESVIIPDRLDERIKGSLSGSDRPIGLLISENRLETFREILCCGKEDAGEFAAYFGIEKREPLVFRTYRIFSNGLPIMSITEKFPQKAVLWSKSEKEEIDAGISGGF